jgi:hypothetical protein
MTQFEKLALKLLVTIADGIDLQNTPLSSVTNNPDSETPKHLVIIGWQRRLSEVASEVERAITKGD